MYHFLIACAFVACAVMTGYAVKEVIAHRWAAYQDGAREVVSFADIRAMDDTTVFDEQPDVVRSNLRSVPVQPSPAYARALKRWRAEGSPAPWADDAPPPADDSWLEDLLAEDPLQIPRQREPGSAS